MVIGLGLLSLLGSYAYKYFSPQLRYLSPYLVSPMTFQVSTLRNVTLSPTPRNFRETTLNTCMLHVCVFLEGAGRVEGWSGEAGGAVGVGDEAKVLRAVGVFGLGLEV